jgi:glycosidase
MIRSARRFVALALAAFASPAAAQQRPLADWTRGATCYEVFVRSFADGDGDGVGDFRGLTAKLDYINDGNPASRRSLGARCIWLMPIAESPSYHGYDVADYYAVDREYGTWADFKAFMTAAHRRGIRVLVDMVLNHSSSEHPYFQAALRDTASPYRAWYRFASPKPDQKGPWGQDVWVKSPVRDEYYYAVFSPGMPDLNYDTPAVREEAKKIARFWVDSMGVDGFRLDAVPFLVEEGSVLEGAPGTHAVLHEYGDYVRSLSPKLFTVAEVYAKLDAQLPYYPNQIDSYFAFELADSIIAGVRSGSARGILSPEMRMQAAGYANRWSPFLRNHDQPRARTELGGSMAKAKTAALLMLTMPGIPFVYYGEEIGMTGAKPDERLRTPMQWRAGAGGGFTRGKPWEQLAGDSATITVAAQERDASSLLNLNRRLIHLRASHPALASGGLVPLTTSNDGVAAYMRLQGERVVLVVANLADSALTGISLSSDSSVLRAGTWRPRSLLGAAYSSPLRIGKDGRVSGYVPLRRLAAGQGYLFELTPPARAR